MFTVSTEIVSAVSSVVTNWRTSNKSLRSGERGLTFAASGEVGDAIP